MCLLLKCPHQRKKQASAIKYCMCKASTNGRFVLQYISLQPCPEYSNSGLECYVLLYSIPRAEYTLPPSYLLVIRLLLLIHTLLGQFYPFHCTWVFLQCNSHTYSTAAPLTSSCQPYQDGMLFIYTRAQCKSTSWARLQGPCASVSLIMTAAVRRCSRWLTWTTMIEMWSLSF